MIKEHISFCEHDNQPATMTNVDAPFLDQWRLAAKDPDAVACSWLLAGGPTNILQSLEDHAVSPECNAPTDMCPQDLHRDIQAFRKYPGVEEAEITETEFFDHNHKGHVASFDTPEELGEFVEGNPILNKIGLVINVTTKTHRAILPRLFDATLRKLFLLSIVCSAGEAINFVLDYSDAFWQVPAS